MPILLEIHTGVHQIAAMRWPTFTPKRKRALRVGALRTLGLCGAGARALPTARLPPRFADRKRSCCAILIALRGLRSDRLAQPDDSLGVDHEFPFLGREIKHFDVSHARIP